MPDIFIPKKPQKAEEEKQKIDPPVNILSPALNDKSHASLLSSFCKNPLDVSFENQHANENIILFLRRHLITNLPWILISLVLSLIPLLIPIITPFFDLSFIFISPQFTIVLIIFYYLIIISYTLINFMSWFYNIFIMTNERIIDIDYSNVIIHNVAETKLNHVEDVNYTQAGFIRSLLNYGDLFVQTAGNERNFEALAVPKPREAARIIANLIGRKA